MKLRAFAALDTARPITLSGRNRLACMGRAARKSKATANPHEVKTVERSMMD